MRFRIRTIMIAVTMIGLATALAVLSWRAEQRETALRARLLAAEKEKDVALSALARLTRLHEKKVLRLPYHDERAPADDPHAGRNESNPGSKAKP